MSEHELRRELGSIKSEDDKWHIVEEAKRVTERGAIVDTADKTRTVKKGMLPDKYRVFKSKAEFEQKVERVLEDCLKNLEFKPLRKHDSEKGGSKIEVTMFRHHLKRCLVRTSRHNYSVYKNVFAAAQECSHVRQPDLLTPFS